MDSGAALAESGERRALRSSFPSLPPPLPSLRTQNHSCNPSTYTKILNIDDQPRLVFFARFDIQLGQEVTYNYRCTWWSNGRGLVWRGGKHRNLRRERGKECDVRGPLMHPSIITDHILLFAQVQEGGGRGAAALLLRSPQLHRIPELIPALLMPVLLYRHSVASWEDSEAGGWRRV